MKIALSGRVAPSLAEEIRPILKQAGHTDEILVIDPDGAIGGDPEGVEVVFFAPGIVADRGAMRAVMAMLEAPSLRWVQGPGAGVDHPLWQRLLDRGVRLTNASGIHGEPIAQYIFTYVLHWERNVARHQAQQVARVWAEIHSGDLAEKTIGIVGYGGIGRATARIARAFGMRVVATRRTPVEDPLLDRYLPPDGLHDLLAESDYVVLCLPFDDATRGLIDAEALAAMRPEAVLINVARGGVVDEPALIETLRAGRIRGATLDVVSEEPLPEGSPLWTLPNCVLTPHDAGYSPLGDFRLGELFVENLRAFLAEEPMRNEIRSTGLTAR